MGLYTRRGAYSQLKERLLKNKYESLALLAALWLPKRLAIVHCPGHQRSDTPMARGNNLADKAAKQVALEVSHLLPALLPDPGAPCLPDKPKYTEEDLRWLNDLPMVEHSNNWYWTADKRIILPELLGESFRRKIHNSTSPGHQENARPPTKR